MRADREFKIWDNGNKCTIIDSYECWDSDFDFEYLINDTPFGILSCNLREYSLEYNNDYMKSTDDVFSWVMNNKKINKFNFNVKDIVKAFGSDTYIDGSGEEVTIDTEKEYSTEELKKLLLDMFDNECFEDGLIYSIIDHTSFDRFIICPFYAYIHSGISISLGDFNDPWDSGMAGFAWYEMKEGEDPVEALKTFKNSFNTYDEYIQGYYSEYHIATYKKADKEWKLDDEYWDYKKSFEDVWEVIDLPIANEVKSFSKEDENIVRKNINIDTEKILNYLEELDF